MLVITLVSALSPILPCPGDEDAFRILHRPFAPYERVKHVAAGDVDGDGDLDAFLSRGVTTFAGGPGLPNLLLVNDGRGVFATSDTLPVNNVPAELAVFLDADGDGDMDIATATRLSGPSQNQLYLGDGVGNFSNATGQLPADASRTATLAVGDVDGDGDADLWNGQVLADKLLLNDGSGMFTESVGAIPAPSFETRVLDLADIDADGDLDALTAGPSCKGQDPVLMVNDGTGTFSILASLPATVDEAIAASFGDLDGDGSPDLFVAVSECGSDQADGLALINDGAGIFSEAPGPTTPIQGALDLRLLDVDDDIDLDLLVAARFIIPHPFLVGIGTEVYVMRLFSNEGTLGFEAVATGFPAIDTAVGSLLVEDFDGDGDDDVWSLDQLFLSDGAGSFGRAGRDYPVPGWGNRPVADVNGDGWLDVFAREDALWIGDGTGNFELAPGALPPTSFPVVGGTIMPSGVFGDVDGDGDPDLVVRRPFDGLAQGPIPQDNSLWLNDGSGTFVETTHNLPQFVHDDEGVNHSTFLVDVDADTDLDIIVGAINDSDGLGGQMEVWRNNGTGVFSFDPLDTPFFSSLIRMDVGDVDSDGDVDAFTAGLIFGVRLFTNNGLGTFAVEPGQGVPSVGPESASFLELGDLDDDGDLDLAVGYAGFRVLLGDGAGDFIDSAHASQPAEQYELFDADFDGDLDLVGTAGWLANAGDATFAPGAEALPFVSPNPNIVDIDLDGDLDILDVDHLLSGVERQIAWSGLPSLGKILAMDVYGPGDGAFLLLASAARLRTPLSTAFGNLSIDPTAILATSSGSLDANGQGRATFAVPSNPAFAGLTVWWQSLLATPIELTNLEGTLLSVY